MKTYSVPVQKINHCGQVIEASAVLISDKWYPLLRVLGLDSRETHPWQVPAVDGVNDASQALETAISMGRDIIEKMPIGYWNQYR